jgi:hypothetical protein
MDRLKERIGADVFESVPHAGAAVLFTEIIANPAFEEFLTLKAYEQLE